jgi:hypothetical protein
MGARLLHRPCSPLGARRVRQFMSDDDQTRVQDNYGGNYQRLVEVKRTYDPDNLFHLNQNFKP